MAVLVAVAVAVVVVVVVVLVAVVVVAIAVAAAAVTALPNEVSFALGGGDSTRDPTKAFIHSLVSVVCSRGIRGSHHLMKCAEVSPFDGDHLASRFLFANCVSSVRSRG